ncbi:MULTISPECIES: glycosyltransferase family 2 protein [unclassified Imperialibacter]|uniref:glycosyltransferase n=1 Tax=unclassified Imperialibacter TaxID=2629706 RepID=UPI0012571B7F|nr:MULTISPECIES: glycosyltransferase [unclassified Imperialibacter]CAD5251436.1 Glycosyl transferase family 2 [Imperialibacter sp. 75]CAD5266226.1 Glycosyl transferase family 2 [Imperialibacter sp. 89]VVT23727.1 Glycosyltransferase [Imperialibacter sp. EC-SDR9]
MAKPKYSFIVPVYNRPEELRELLDSLCDQNAENFEVIVVEDGSEKRADKVVETFAGRLDLTYLFQPNAGPGAARNNGALQAKGEWLVFLDSDVIVPQGYLASLEALPKLPLLFGGPDNAAPDFSATQKAINYSMTSFLTTGGIRGRKKSMEAYKPRSFNMGIESTLFRKIEGFRGMRFGEDIDLSLRAEKAGVRGVLIEEAWVYHKRRSNFRQFYKQVFNSGVARIHLQLLHPGSTKAVHTFPALFAVAVLFLVVWALLFNANRLFPLLIYAAIILVDSTTKNGLPAGILSVPAAFVQLVGYGLGFLKAGFEVYVLRRKPKFGYANTFYK